MLSFELLFSVTDLVTFVWPFPFKVIFKDTQELFDIGIVFDNKYMWGYFLSFMTNLKACYFLSCVAQSRMYPTLTSICSIVKKGISDPSNDAIPFAKLLREMF